MTTVGAAYLYERSEKSSQEIAIACLAVALAGIFLTLIAAPWQIQLLLLGVALWSYRATKTKWLS
ncbi:hypothetical protein IQ268_04715 [Oculatella sp. LEGE 06141]|uniref:hypothetical protein n=1 Tax=Oculatella sp. LEGE 06141 TaxID=1828648 RepID=UPI001881BD37|nr:hypothetical protein [Oculatella sp. LEGE 06141]MBE9177885.1 hypothetical protein [Oculatella sp. LEGE 06141]